MNLYNYPDNLQSLFSPATESWYMCMVGLGNPTVLKKRSASRIIPDEEEVSDTDENFVFLYGPERKKRFSECSM